MKKIYICNTYYHIFISLIKNIKDNAESSIVIANTVPDVDTIIKSLKKSKLFKDVYCYDEVAAKAEFNSQKLERKIFRKDEMIKIFNKYSDIDFKLYDDIYIYNDWTTLGAYLIDKKIYYHLIEDGMDFFRYIKGNLGDRTTFLNPDFKYKLKRVIKKVLHVGYDFFGQSKYVIDIEVNDKSKVLIKNNNVIEVKKETLYNSLTKEDKNIIYNIFVDKNLNFKAKEKMLLILTQPLYTDGLVTSLDIQVKIYSDIINKYKDYNIYVKPHPRDTYDYKRISNNIFIISKNIPIEILSYNNDVKFDKAITVTSTAINSIDFAKEKIELGFDFIRKYDKGK